MYGYNFSCGLRKTKTLKMAIGPTFCGMGVNTAQIRITEENVQDVLPVSCILQICPVKKACCDFIQSQLDPSNCIGIKDFSEIYGCLDLSKAAEKFIFRHFLQVSESEKFQTLPEDRLVDLISRDELFVKSEDEVRFESMIISSFDSLH